MSFNNGRSSVEKHNFWPSDSMDSPVEGTMGGSICWQRTEAKLSKSVKAALQICETFLRCLCCKAPAEDNGVTLYICTICCDTFGDCAWIKLHSCVHLGFVWPRWHQSSSHPCRRPSPYYTIIIIITALSIGETFLFAFPFTHCQDHPCD